MVKNQDRVPFHKIVSHKFKLAEINEKFPIAEWSQRQTEVTRAMPGALRELSAVSFQPSVMAEDGGTQ